MIKKEEKVSSKKIYSGRIINLYVDDVLMDGNKTIREYVKHPGGVTLLAFIDGKLIIERQFRYPYQEIIYELPAGKLEKGEDPNIAAIRELEEETGYKAHELKYYGCIYPTVGYTDEILYIFEANKLEKTNQHFDVDEYVEIEFITLEEAIQMIKDNKIKDAKTIAAINYYLIHHDKIKLN